MYVCVCHAVSDKTVEQCIDGGARTVDAVTRACRAGGDCGACRGMIEEMIDARGGDAPHAAPSEAHRRPGITLLPVVSAQVA